MRRTLPGLRSVSRGGACGSGTALVAGVEPSCRGRAGTAPAAAAEDDDAVGRRRSRRRCGSGCARRPRGPCTRTVSGTTSSLAPSRNGVQLGEEAERLPRHPAGERADQVVDEDAERLGAEASPVAAHSASTARGIERDDEVAAASGSPTSSDVELDPHHVAGRLVGRAHVAAPGPSRCAARGPGLEHVSLIRCARALDVGLADQLVVARAVLGVAEGGELAPRGS